jgi:hypothetical protein
MSQMIVPVKLSHNIPRHQNIRIGKMWHSAASDDRNSSETAFWRKRQSGASGDFHRWQYFDTWRRESCL